MDRKRNGFFDISIEFVFSNWEPGEEPEHEDHTERERFFELVRSYDIPLVTLSWKRYLPELRRSDRAGWRLEYGRALREKLGEHPFDLGVLAGYMLWVDDETCTEYDLINLHPALPGGPKGTWQEVIWQLIEERAERQGAMIHLTTPDWDEGPALTYCSFPIVGEDWDPLWREMEERIEREGMEEIRRQDGSEPLFLRIREEGERRELPLIAQSIRLFSEGRVFIRDQQLYVDGRPLKGAYDLTEEVESELR
jgi:phosphoribosylglycinamide formyltransferase-1